ncbi:MAG: RNA polymerase sigma-70 factor [Bacteroidales bacterium]|nr:RNA polymerase sigma-70 factor [Bacteroidales bacterium]
MLPDSSFSQDTANAIQNRAKIPAKSLLNFMVTKIWLKVSSVFHNHRLYYISSTQKKHSYLFQKKYTFATRSHADCRHMMGHEDWKYKDLELPESMESGNWGGYFQYIWEQYSAKVYNFMNSMLINKSLAEDLVQEVFLKVWEKRGEIDPEKNLEAYIYTIARNLIYKETRKMLVNSAYMQAAQEMISEAEETTERDIDYNFAHRHLSEIIGQMPPARRKIYLLNKSYGMSIDDIARKLQISSKTVENQLYQANVFIRKKFKNLMRVFALLWIYMIYGQ